MKDKHYEHHFNDYQEALDEIDKLSNKKLSIRQKSKERLRMLGALNNQLESAESMAEDAFKELKTQRKELNRCKKLMEELSLKNQRINA